MNIKANLELLLDAVEAWPEKEFDLSEVHCGACYCVLGIIGVTPEFQAMGFSLLPITLAPGGRKMSYLTHTSCPGRVTSAGMLEDYFGAFCYARLFEPRQLGTWDRELTEDCKAGLDADMSDKALALARIRRQIALCQQ